MWAKTYTVDFGATGDNYVEGLDKIEDNVDAIITYLNLLKNTHTGTSAPASPDTGQLWSDTNYTPALFKFYNGSVWVPVVRNQGRGALTNGYISVTDAAGLTVAIKNNLGTDPTTTNPVVANIGGTERVISAALSVAKADGTSWGVAGSAELATKEVDWFVYLGYNATDGVVLGFSRFPGASQYDEFSATPANEKYCAISTITTAAAGDDYEVIGRFAATLSAGAGYTWTVPTYTTINLVQKPIHETRWLSFGPVHAGYSSDPTYVGKYKIVRNTIFIKIKASSVGTSNATTTTITIPFTPKNDNYVQAIRVLASDNGGALGNGVAVLRSNADPAVGKIVDLFYGDVVTGTTWTNSGTKYVYSLDVDFEI